MRFCFAGREIDHTLQAIHCRIVVDVLSVTGRRQSAKRNNALLFSRRLYEKYRGLRCWVVFRGNPVNKKRPRKAAEV
jgi:hypothetical protein